MRRKLVIHSAAVLLAVSAGCGSIDRRLQERVAAEASDLSPRVDDDKAVLEKARAVARAEEEPVEPAALPESAGLDDYVAIALRDNPSIRQAVRTLQVLGYQVPQVTSLDDPMITLVPPTGDMIQTAGGMLDGSVGVAQKLPFPGKLSVRGRVAEQAVRMQLAALADTRIGVIAQVQKAYYSLYLADVSIHINHDSAQLLRQIREVAAARYRAGAATQQDVLRAEVEIYNLSDELITLEQQQATAQALLNSAMNRPVDAPLPAPEPFELAAVEWKLPEATRTAVASNPRLQRLQAQIERDIQSIKLAKLDYLPDLTVGYTYTFVSPSGISPVANGDDVWNFAFGLNLPIWWQRLRARVLSMNAAALSSVEEYDQLRNQIFFQLQDTLVKIDTQYRRAVLFRDLIVPRAWQTVEVSTSAYQAGGIEFTALIDNWRKWLDASLAYHRALAELEQRFADLQQQIGLRVPRRAADLEPAAAVQAATEGRTEP